MSTYTKLLSVSNELVEVMNHCESTKEYQALNYIKEQAQQLFSAQCSADDVMTSVLTGGDVCERFNIALDDTCINQVRDFQRDIVVAFEPEPMLEAHGFYAYLVNIWTDRLTHD
ncbi:TPA: hypothetical protein ACVOYR_001473 [Vibrio alginolyticus]|uniref:hypothetical protein n=1 Tax=Vibrio alginolyticus TaxID=663 RepID=UPI002160C36C|nr:hypothetical protein [Vibrio alginolyticus]MCS0223027.1 hypothetical protein [Vibrio alginolyticus]